LTSPLISSLVRRPQLERARLENHDFLIGKTPQEALLLGSAVLCLNYVEVGELVEARIFQ
jgi:hypothetical protein